MAHPFHLVEKSPWPFMASFSTMFTMSGLLLMFQSTKITLFVTAMSITLLISFLWWRDVDREASFQGLHTKQVSTGMKMGMLLFIVSEVMFFFSFFWAFFHSSLSPTLELGLTWPPSSIKPFNILSIPLLNTLILISSGVSVTWAHNSIIMKDHTQSMQSMVLTIILGVYFTALQITEYKEAPFSIADSAYGTTFFVATGFHGLHVIIGTLLLAASTLRLHKAHLSSTHHTGLEASIWYWHFVDVIWLFLFTSIYWWGS